MLGILYVNGIEGHVVIAEQLADGFDVNWYLGLELPLMCQGCCLQDQAAHVRRALLRKIHNYLRDRTLNLKYASAYALCAVDTVKDIAQEVSHIIILL